MAKLQALSALADAGDSLPLGNGGPAVVCEVEHHPARRPPRSRWLVARQADRHDRRTWLAVLTATGRKACKEGLRVQRETERALLGGLTRDESAQLAVC